MGEVWLAKHVGTGAPAAIKIANRRDPGYGEALRREIKAYARCSSAHIPRVLDQGQDGPYIWMAVEYLAGQTLDGAVLETLDSFDFEFGETTVAGSASRTIKSSVKPASIDSPKWNAPQSNYDDDWRRQMGWMRDVARALSDLHEQNLLHRDIKPSNILISDDLQRTAYLIDFGLVYDLDERSKAGLAGTMRFMAPEQVNAEPSLSTATDIYGLAATFFKVLTGRYVCGDAQNRSEVLHAVQFEDTPQLSEFRPDLGSDLNKFFADCLAKNPIERPKSVSELIERLDLILENAIIENARIARTVRSLSLMIVVMVMVMVMVAIAAILWVVIGGPDNSSERSSAHPSEHSTKQLSVDQDLAHKDPARFLVEIDKQISADPQNTDAIDALHVLVARAAPRVAQEFLLACSLRVVVNGGFGILDEVVAACGRLHSKFPEAMEFVFIPECYRVLFGDENQQQAALTRIREVSLSQPTDARLIELEKLICHILDLPEEIVKSPQVRLDSVEALWFRSLRQLWVRKDEEIDRRRFEDALSEIQQFVVLSEKGVDQGQNAVLLPLRGLETCAHVRLGNHGDALEVMEKFILEEAQDNGRRWGILATSIAQGYLRWAETRNDLLVSKANIRVKRLARENPHLATILPWIIHKQLSYQNNKNGALPFESLLALPFSPKSLTETDVARIALANLEFARHSGNDENSSKFYLEFMERIEFVFASFEKSSPIKGAGRRRKLELGAKIQEEITVRFKFLKWACLNVAEATLQNSSDSGSLDEIRKRLKRMRNVIGKLQDRAPSQRREERRDIDLGIRSFFIDTNGKLESFRTAVAVFRVSNPAPSATRLSIVATALQRAEKLHKDIESTD